MTINFLPLRRIAVALTALALVALAIVSFSSPAKASASPESNWMQVGSSASGPPARFDGSMVYDAATGTTLLFGGFNGSELGDTWTWNGSSWVRLSPATSPPALRGAAMVYDPATHNVVLFGGLSSSGLMGDTWTWDGANWTQQLVAGPAARSGATMAYDATTNDVVLFGGNSVNGPMSDTWLWNGSQWTSPTVAGLAPAPRYQQSMAYDSADHSVVLFGGLTSGGALNDTWTWNGTNWTRQPAAGPPARFGASMFYDATTGQIVLFGGATGTTNLSDTWTWNGSSWGALSSVTAPSGRYLSSVAYNTTTNGAVLFGGYNGTTILSDTWSFMDAPSAPFNVRATSNANSQSVVTWSAPQSNGGGVIYGYDVTTTDVTAPSRGGQTCSGATTVGTVPSSGIVATTCTVTGLTNGDQYSFAVSAINTVGTGPSAISNLARPATAPQAPVISKVVANAGQVNVYWTVPAQDGGTPVASYRVTASPGGAFCHVPRSMLSCRIGGLESGAMYTFTMTATNAAGTSPASAPTTATQVTALPGAPFITSKNVAGPLITLGWRPPASSGGVALVGYDIYIGTSPSHAILRPLISVPANRLSYTFRGTPGQTYFAIVRAVNASGIGPFSNQVAAVASTTPSPKGGAGRLVLPSAPLIVSTTVHGPFVTIRWRPPASNGGERLAGYDVYPGSSPNGAASRPLVSVPFYQFSYTYRGTPGQVSYVIVRAVNTVGIGPFSNQVAAVAK